MGGKREEVERDVGVMHGREAGKSFLMIFSLFLSKLSKIITKFSNLTSIYLLIFMQFCCQHKNDIYPR